MSIWFFLWLILSVTLLGFFGWTYVILYRQKTTWKAYAGKRKLRYKSNALFEAPELSGPFDDYTINLFPSEHTAPDARGSRKMTAMEVQIDSKFPFEGVIASGGMVGFSRQFGYSNEMRPKHKAWENNDLIASDTKGMMEEYLNKSRLEALIELIALPSTWVILIFRNDIALLRFDSADPHLNSKTLDDHITKMVNTVKTLELKSGEAKRLKEIKATAPKNEAKIELKDGDMDGGDLELEDDE